MKFISYPIIGLVLGALFGVFMGYTFGVAVVKRSEIERMQEVQIPIFTILGAAVGCLWGIKVAAQESKMDKPNNMPKKQSKKNPAATRLITACKRCKVGIGYDPQTERPPTLCNDCTLKYR